MADSVAVADEPLESMNTRLPNLIDHSLGFAFLDMHQKQQLIQPGRCAFHSHEDASLRFENVENTSTAAGAMKLKQLTKAFNPVHVDVGKTRLHEATHAETVLWFNYTRVVAKRSIAVPNFRNLLPVKAGKHATANRWPVEFLGNSLCVEEYYGGQVSVSFSWNKDSNVKLSEVMADVESAATDVTVQGSVFNTSLKSQVKCFAVVKGFPNNVGDLLTYSGVMRLIASLKELPVKCAVAVGMKTVLIQTVTDFPRGLMVESVIRDEKTIDRLLSVVDRLKETGHKSSATAQLVDDIVDMIEDASYQDRSLLPDLAKLTNSVLEGLRHHGGRVELYKRGEEYRLHTDNCDDNTVTASASESAMIGTVGLAALVVYPMQMRAHARAKVWLPPPHYEAKEFATTSALVGYYDRVKVQVLFNDDKLVKQWRGHLERIQATRGARVY